MPKLVRKGPRQGDILFVPRKEKFVGRSVPAINGRTIIAEGEATGHHHYVEATPNVVLLDDGIDTAISVAEHSKKSDRMLKHQEHTPVELPFGESDVVRQRHVVPGSQHVVRTMVD